MLTLTWTKNKPLMTPFKELMLVIIYYKYCFCFALPLVCLMLDLLQVSINNPVR